VKELLGTAAAALALGFSVVDSVIKNILPGQEEDQRLDNNSGQTSITEASSQHFIGQNSSSSDPAGGDGAAERRRQSHVNDVAVLRLHSPIADSFEDQNKHGADQHGRIKRHEQLVLNRQQTHAAVDDVSDTDDALIERHEEEEQPL